MDLVKIRGLILAATVTYNLEQSIYKNFKFSTKLHHYNYQTTNVPN
jgi:hypothetical protein